MPGVRLHAFECGVLRCDKSAITRGRDVGATVDIPVPFYLIEHPEARVLLDTGNARRVARDARAHWGEAVDFAWPIMREEQYVVEQLRALGVEPESIDLVVLSHLHLDHAGGVGEFPNAVYLVRRRELEYALSGAPSYIPADFDKDVDWQCLEAYGDEHEGHDLVGDGSIVLHPTPGHSPGHQSVVLRLGGGPALLTVDAAYTEESLRDSVLTAPELLWDEEMSLASMERLRRLRDENGAWVIYGHDPVTWPSVRRALRYY